MKSTVKWTEGNIPYEQPIATVGIDETSDGTRIEVRAEAFERCNKARFVIDMRPDGNIHFDYVQLEPPNDAVGYNGEGEFVRTERHSHIVFESKAGFNLRMLSSDIDEVFGVTLEIAREMLENAPTIASLPEDGPTLGSIFEVRGRRGGRLTTAQGAKKRS